VRRALLILVAAAGLAHASPVHDRVLLAPTAELPAAGGVIASSSLDRHGAFALDAGYGLGGIAEVELALADSDARGMCTIGCQPIELATAAFRFGAPEDAAFVGQPAVVLGVRSTIDASADHGSRATTAYLVASRRIDLISLHAGGELVAAGNVGAVDPPVRIRPLAGFELRPPAFPKTTLLADLTWQPKFATTATSELAFAWGVRYQSLKWAAIELAVRHDASGFGDPDVFVRVTGTWATSAK
jgi:hypothetical protein